MGKMAPVAWGVVVLCRNRYGMSKNAMVYK